VSDQPTDIEYAQLDWDEDGQPQSRAFGDVYFSRANGLEETRHVFLKHNQLAERFAQLSLKSSLSPESPLFCIGETGFGSGLNFLAAWQLWNQTAAKQAYLHFISTEKYPLSKTDLTRALALWPELGELAQALVEQYPVFIGKGFHRLIFAEGRVTLTLIIDDAAQGFAQLLASPHPYFAHSSAKVDAWFLDGFAPAKNPQMWSPELFSAIGWLSHSGTTAATFSAAGIVKQGLHSAGFTVHKVPGFGRKREMVSAVFNTPPDASPVTSTAATESAESESAPAAKIFPRHTYTTPWALVRNSERPASRTAAVIGGGLAGCHTARALALRGWRVTLIERHAELAQGASGNPQGVLYAKLSPKQEPLAAFNLASLQFALRHYAAYWSPNANRNHTESTATSATEQTIGTACGVLQLAHTAAEQSLQEQLRATFSNAETLVRFVSKEEASKIAGITLPYSGLYFPSAGWLNPIRLCAALVDHPNIQIQYQRSALNLLKNGDYWQVHTEAQQLIEAAVVVVANATDAVQFEQTQHLPLKAIRGQVSYLPATAMSRELQTVICSEGYIAPASSMQGGKLQHCTGATFNLKDNEAALRTSDHQTNLANLHEHLPVLACGWSELKPDVLEGRVAFRCATTDYLPVVGPAPVLEDFLADYAALRKDARSFIPQAGSYWTGLYVNLGHGSRGLAYTPLCAELLAAQICNEPLPLARDLVHALHPARFIIRNLQRNRC
jgi:tRNA 5-methylaminomethyl-2-thiouridine biosynthesis bifunctional protein